MSQHFKSPVTTYISNSNTKLQGTLPNYNWGTTSKAKIASPSRKFRMLYSIRITISSEYHIRNHAKEFSSRMNS